MSGLQKEMGKGGCPLSACTYQTRDQATRVVLVGEDQRGSFLETFSRIKLMRSIDVIERPWKECLHDALLELNPPVFREKLKVAKQAIDVRLAELQSAANPNPLETIELIDGLNALCALGFLQEREPAKTSGLPKA